MTLPYLSKNLKRFREANGLTQKDLGEVLNIQRQSYCNYETGRRTPPLDLLADIASFYGVTLDALIGPPPSDPVHSQEDTSITQLMRDFRKMTPYQRELLHTISKEITSSSKGKSSYPQPTIKSIKKSPR